MIYFIRYLTRDSFNKLDMLWFGFFAVCTYEDRWFDAAATVFWRVVVALVVIVVLVVFAEKEERP